MLLLAALKTRHVLFLVGVGGIGALAAGCRAPTEVTVAISTTAPCSALGWGVAIIVGADATATESKAASRFVSATTRACAADGTVGTLVLTPGAGTASIVVVAGYNGHDTSQCTPVNGYKDCIVARRSLSFVEHVALTIPIELAAECVNRPCDARTTCRNGSCVNAHVDCNSSDCSDLGPGAPADAGPALADASIDATADAGVRDLSVDASPPGVPASDLSCATDRGGPMASQRFPGGYLSYCIDRTEVTQLQYDSFLAAEIPRPAACSGKSTPAPDRNRNSCDATTYSPGRTPHLPVVCVDRCDAETYCNWAHKRLCGAEEWPVACQNGNGANLFPYGPVYQPGLCNDASHNSTEASVPVASIGACKSAGASEIYDMSGNVWEWAAGVTLPRGGGFHAQGEFLKCRYDQGPAEDLTPEIGFRCCKDAAPK